MRNRRNKRKPTKVNNGHKYMTYAGVVIGLLAFSVIFALLNIANTNVIRGIKIEQIDISGLSKDDAKAKIEEWYEEVALKAITLNYEEIEENVSIEELNAQNDIDNKIEEALKIGRNGNILIDNYQILFTMLFNKNMNIDITYDEEKLDSKIEEISNKLPESVVESSYYIDDEELVIKKGKNGIKINSEELKNEITGKIKESEDRTIQIPVVDAIADDINIEKIYEEIHEEPRDAYILQNPVRVYGEQNGIDFAISMEEAKAILQEDKEEYSIPIKITHPARTLAQLGEQAFPEVLSEFTTRYDASNKNRSNNLELASNKINGTVVLPGETFSYNKTVGARTISKGYKEAAVYAGGKVVQGIGGGICQLSSTVYDAALYANLEITKRSNHRFLTSYTQPGFDATVSWGTIDLCFKNTRQYPIKIASSVVNGIVKVQILGIKEDVEYDVDIQTTVLDEIYYKTTYINDNTIPEGTEVIEQYGSNGAKSETYKIVSLDGIIVSKTLLSTDTYSSLDEVIRKGTKKVNIEDIPQQTPTEDLPGTVLNGGPMGID